MKNLWCTANKLKILSRMYSSKLSYEDAVHRLNGLQSNKKTIEQVRKEIKNGKPCTNIDDMKNYLERIGVTLSMLDELSVIHIAGTKGKGSTSAMCESILRQHGYRTGFYSSPHLVAVRERIRLNGMMVSKDKFASYFHEVYDLLHKSQAYEGDMPKYFAFLTVLAFNVFLKEKVDVAVVEVGIGGIVDYTNVLRKVPVVAITALGLDHTSILGNTLTEIAQAKAGIMKSGSVAYTVEQDAEAMTVLQQVAKQVQCQLIISPKYESYEFPSEPKISLPVEAYQVNASLAIQLAHAWMRLDKCLNQNSKRRNGIKDLNINLLDSDKESAVISIIPMETVIGLKECQWPGRYHVINTNYAKFYLDGAHTKESMEICAQWFKNNNRLGNKLLIFSATGDRDAEVLLTPLKDINFQIVYFVVPSACSKTDDKNDNYYNEQNNLLSRCHNHSHIWRELVKDSCNRKVIVAECVSDALKSIKGHSQHNDSVLITGSLHLVGAALSILDSSLCND